jgi:transposase
LIHELRRTDRVAGKRKRYSAAFKAEVALEVIKGEATVAGLVSRRGVHQTQINLWKRRAIEGMAGVFSNNAEVAAAEREGELEKLHA